MKKLLILLSIVLVLTLSACSIDGESEVYSHLQDQDPSKLNDEKVLEEETQEPALETDNPKCLGQYDPEDIANRDIERQAVVEKNIDLCYDLPDEPLIIKCPGQATLVYYSKDRCIQALS